MHEHPSESDEEAETLDAERRAVVSFKREATAEDDHDRCSGDNGDSDSEDASQYVPSLIAYTQNMRREINLSDMPLGSAPGPSCSSNGTSRVPSGDSILRTNFPDFGEHFSSPSTSGGARGEDEIRNVYYGYSCVNILSEERMTRDAERLSEMFANSVRRREDELYMCGRDLPISATIFASLLRKQENMARNRSICYNNNSDINHNNNNNNNNSNNNDEGDNTEGGNAERNELAVMREELLGNGDSNRTRFSSPETSSPIDGSFSPEEEFSISDLEPELEPEPEPEPEPESDPEPEPEWEPELKGERVPPPVRQTRNNKRLRAKYKLAFTLPRAMVGEYRPHFGGCDLDEMHDCGAVKAGIIRIDPRNASIAYIDSPDGGLDVLVEGLADRNRALDGDEVYFAFKEARVVSTGWCEEEVERTGMVVGLRTKYHTRVAVGFLKMKGKKQKFALFFPKDLRFPRMKIKRSEWPPGFERDPESFGNVLFSAKLKSWTDLRFAEGTLNGQVGIVGDLEVETEAILSMFDLNVKPYTHYLRSFAPQIPHLITAEDVESRDDFREECIFTIDPADSLDSDCALSCRRLHNGNYLVGVHVADVAFFLREGSPLDLAVAKKGTTVYLANQVHNMLPLDLCYLCSLTPGEHKLAFSILLELTPEAETVFVHFTRSIVNTCAKFTRDQVQYVIDGSREDLPVIYGGHRPITLMRTITCLYDLAVRLREDRFERGALNLDDSKLVIKLKDNSPPVNYSLSRSRECDWLMEEFTLLANISVAEKIYASYPKIAVLQQHSPPPQYLMERLQKKMEKFGIDLDISSPSAINASIDKYSGTGKDSAARRMALTALVSKVIPKPKYFCAYYYPNPYERRHYGLDLDLYTHFTHPVKRYPDILVQRLLSSALGYRKRPFWTPRTVNRLADVCNRKSYDAKLATEKSNEFFLNIALAERMPMICEAIIYDMKGKCLDCILTETGTRCKVRLQDSIAHMSVKTGLRSKKLIVSWPKTENNPPKKQVIGIFSIIKVELRRSSPPGENVKVTLHRSD